MRHCKDDSGQRCVVMANGSRQIWDEGRHGEWQPGVVHEEAVAVVDEVKVEPVPDPEPEIVIHERPGTGMGFRTVDGEAEGRMQPDDGPPGPWHQIEAIPDQDPEPDDEEADTELSPDEQRAIEEAEHAEGGTDTDGGEDTGAPV